MSTLVSDKILQLQKSISEMKTNISTSEEKLKKAVLQLANLKRSHESIIFDTKSLLKIFAKTHDFIGMKAYEYLTQHRNFIAELTALIEGLNIANLSEKTILPGEIISKLDSEIPSVYEELLR